ncbi:MAG: hypothetical protein R6V27_16375 [Balneolaceae bacterium]
MKLPKQVKIRKVCAKLNQYNTPRYVTTEMSGSFRSAEENSMFGG